MKKAIVIGTSTGIGKALVYALAEQGYQVGITGRYLDKLQALQAELSGNHFIKKIDLNDSPEESMNALSELISEMKGVNLIIANAGILPVNPEFDWSIEREGSRVNVLGFQSMCNVAVKFFEKQGYGHIVGISSIASLRGSGRCPAYNASKAFMSTYMEGLRQRLYQTEIYVTDIRPGLIRTQMTEGRPLIFWDVGPERAAEDILKAVNKKKRVSYIPGRWWWVAQVMKYMPEFLYHRSYKKYINREDYEDFPQKKSQGIHD